MFVSTLLCVGEAYAGADRIAGVAPDEAFPGIHGQLAAAAVAGDTELMTRLVRDGANPNAHGLDGLTPLTWALMARSHTGLTKLLELGADPNAPIPIYGTVVLVAAYEDVDALKILLEHGGKPNITDDCDTPLSMAARTNLAYGEVVRRIDLLLAHGADINLQACHRGALAMASVQNRFDVVLYLLLKGYNYDLADFALGVAMGNIIPDGPACRNKQRTIALLERRGFVVKRWSENDTPCAMPADLDGIEGEDRGVPTDTLPRHIVSPRFTFPELQAKLILAAMVNDMPRARALVARGADPNAVSGKHDDTPRAHALVAGGRDPSTVSRKYAPLFFAVQRRSVDGVHNLIDLGADPNGPAGVYGTVAIYAARDKSFEIFKLLFENGADPNKIGDCLTPIMAVIMSPLSAEPELEDDQLRRISLLLDRGGDPNGEACGRDAADSAPYYGRFRVLLLLLSRGYNRDLNTLARRVFEAGVPRGTAVYRHKMEVLEALRRRGVTYPNPN